MRDRLFNAAPWTLLSMLLVLPFSGLVGTARPTYASDTTVNFETQIAPIFEQHCIRCHSPNIAKGELSLETNAGLLEQGLVSIEQPESSRLLHVVSSIDGQPAEMPQDGSPLSDAEVNSILQWIVEGASWPTNVVVRERSKADSTWWSLQPVADVEPPAIHVQNPIDRFVYAKLAANGLQTSPIADRHSLIRRLVFDMTGLPPSPDEVESFVNDTDEQAYEKLVDRLLASREFGQRWARHWLDISHYADTHGFERDQRRDNAWRFRDYVIRSFNDDKPYGQFIREQIAGDVISPDDPNSVVATGFLAAGPWDYVGQVETQNSSLRRAARAADLDDMLTQVVSSTMAMTVNCARCHDHKLDPISQSEYYELTAVFAGLKRAERDVSSSERSRYDAEKSRLESAIKSVAAQIARFKGARLDLADIVGGGDGYGSGKKNWGIDPRTGELKEPRAADLENLRLGQFSKSTVPFVDGVFIPAVAETQISSTGLFATGLPASNGKAWDMIRNGPVNQQFSTTLGSIDFAASEHSMIGLHANAGITFDLQDIRAANGFADALTFKSTIGYGGQPTVASAEFRVLVDGDLRAHGKLGRNDTANVEISIPLISRFLTFIATDGGDGYSMDQVSFGDPHLSPALHNLKATGSTEQITALELEKQNLESQLTSLVPPPAFYGVVAEQPPLVNVFIRGNPETPGDTVAPGTLRFGGPLNTFGQLDMPESERRLALANWVTDPSNPLTNRVIVNRLWHWHFGRGIVGTPSDFGFGGEKPSHPELLDWLAAELARANGSLKHIHRLIVTSQTYQMSSWFGGNAAAASAIDSDNRLLWRMNPRRLEAEAIRDAVLSISGKLNPQMDGPGYRDFDYEEAYAPIYKYKTANDPELWRRSIYRYIVRTTPQQFLTTLDCPDPTNFTPRRSVSTTALQSLALFNNEFMLLQSQYFADRIAQSDASLDNQIDLAFQLAFSRHVTADELNASRTLVNKQGLMHLCRVLLNANEFVNVD